MTIALRSKSRHATPSLSKQRLRLWIRLLRAARAIEAEVRDRLRVQFDVTLPQFDVMAALDEALRRCDAIDPERLGADPRRPLCGALEVLGRVDANPRQGEARGLDAAAPGACEHLAHRDAARLERRAQVARLGAAVSRHLVGDATRGLVLADAIRERAIAVANPLKDFLEDVELVEA